MSEVEDQTSILAVDEDEYVFNRQLSPEENLWAAVTHRALMDAKGYRLGSDSDSSNNHIQRWARKWFRDRELQETGGWGWIIDAIGIPKWIERRILREAFIDKANTPIRIFSR